MKFQFPQEIKDVLGALADDIRWDILEAIINSDNKMAYSEIKKVLKVPDGKKGTLDYHLKELQKAGWIRNYIKSEEGIRNKSFYSLSKFAQKAMEGVLQAMNRRSYPKKNSDATLSSLDSKDYIQNTHTRIFNEGFGRYNLKYSEMETANVEQTNKNAELFGIISDTRTRTPQDTIHEQRQQTEDINSIHQSRDLDPSSEIEHIGVNDRLPTALIRRIRA